MAAIPSLIHFPYLSPMQTRPAPKWISYLSYLPVLLYFVVKYLVIGSENITSKQSWMLIGAVVLAEIALWQYRRSFTRTENTD